MSDILALLNTYRISQKQGDRALLATIVETKGSTYRKPGARMLVTDTGCVAGTISGGCLESDIQAHAMQVLEVGEPRLVTYDTTIEEDLQWGFGLGCNGVVWVFVERLTDTPLNPLTVLETCVGDRRTRILATVFASTVPCIQLGRRLLLHPDGTISTNLEDAEFVEAIATDARVALQTAGHQAATLTQTYTLATGTVRVLVETLQPPPHLTLFGAGRDALPVLNFAKAIGWQVTVIDCRASEATFDRFSHADKILLTHRENICKQVAIDDRAIAVIMTHNYLDDRAILKMLLTSPACYIGILGAKHRTQRLLDELSGEIAFDRSRLYTPIGLDIGASTPEEIAIAIVAEIQAVLSNRKAGFLTIAAVDR